MSKLKTKILHVSEKLFHDRGINSTGVDTIVAIAGTTKMTLYKYYITKEQLILEVLNYNQHKFQTWLDQQLEAECSSAMDKLEKLFVFIEDWVMKSDYHGVAFISASSEFPNEENNIHKLAIKQSHDFKDFIHQLVADAGVNDVECLSRQLSLLFKGAIESEQIKRGSGSIKYARKAAQVLITHAKQ